MQPSRSSADSRPECCNWDGHVDSLDIHPQNCSNLETKCSQSTGERQRSVSDESSPRCTTVVYSAVKLTAESEEWRNWVRLPLIEETGAESGDLLGWIFLNQDAVHLREFERICSAIATPLARGGGEMAALGARVLFLSPRFPAACFSRCLDLSSSGLGGRQTDLSAFRGSPALARHLNFNGGRRPLSVTSASMSTGAESAANNPGYCDSPDAATQSYHVQQTMYKIKDPKASLNFYSKVLGMTLIKRLDFEEAKFSLYFLGYESPESIPNAPAERTAFLFKCKATLELTHNWGTESDPNFKGYLSGINDPRGYGLLGITVDDVYKACERFEKLGVEFAKRPDDGNMKGLAFIKDPDGYWIEIFDAFHMCRMVDGPSS